MAIVDVVCLVSAALAVGWHGHARNLAGNPDSPQAVIFLASITDVTMGS